MSASSVEAERAREIVGVGKGELCPESSFCQIPSPHLKSHSPQFSHPPYQQPKLGLSKWHLWASFSVFPFSALSQEHPKVSVHHRLVSDQPPPPTHLQSLSNGGCKSGCLVPMREHLGPYHVFTELTNYRKKTSPQRPKACSPGSPELEADDRAVKGGFPECSCLAPTPSWHSEYLAGKESGRQSHRSGFSCDPEAGWLVRKWKGHEKRASPNPTSTNT